MELRDGYGILKNPDGIPIYRGDWRNDLYHGNGELYNEDPLILKVNFNFQNFDEIESFWTSYIGDFKEGTMDGFGSLYLSNDEKIVGIFRDGKVDGQATFYVNTGDIVLGVWEKNYFVQEV